MSDKHEENQSLNDLDVRIAAVEAAGRTLALESDEYRNRATKARSLLSIAEWIEQEDAPPSIPVIATVVLGRVSTEVYLRSLPDDERRAIAGMLRTLAARELGDAPDKIAARNAALEGRLS
jgi:hypothetical protein